MHNMAYTTKVEGISYPSTLNYFIYIIFLYVKGILPMTHYRMDHVFYIQKMDHSPHILHKPFSLDPTHLHSSTLHNLYLQPLHFSFHRDLVF